MTNTAYDLHLKGYVGGADFDRNAVDKTLAANSGKRVNVLIDSLGGDDLFIEEKWNILKEYLDLCDRFDADAGERLLQQVLCFAKRLRR